MEVIVEAGMRFSRPRVPVVLHRTVHAYEEEKEYMYMLCQCCATPMKKRGGACSDASRGHLVSTG